MLPGVDGSLLGKAYRGAAPTIMLTSYPQADEALIDEKAEAEMQAVIELITRTRNIRSEMNIKPGERITVLAAIPDEDMRAVLVASTDQIKRLARISEITFSETLRAPKASAKAVLGGGAEIAVPLEGLIDFQLERERLNREREKLQKEAAKVDAQLANPQFVDRAPEEKVSELKNRLNDLAQRNAALDQSLEALA
jgi:valyl-tRNA synthetase